LLGPAEERDWKELPQIRFNLGHPNLSRLCVTAQFDQADCLVAGGPLFKAEFQSDGLHFCRLCVLEAFAGAVCKLLIEVKSERRIVPAKAYAVHRDVTAEDAATAWHNKAECECPICDRGWRKDVPNEPGGNAT